MIVSELIEQLNRINPEIEVSIQGRQVAEILIYDENNEDIDTEECIIVGYGYDDNYRQQIGVHSAIVFSEFHKFYQE